MLRNVGGKSTYINVTFDSDAQGQLAMVIYEWGDMSYLGKVTSTVADLPKTYVCTSDAVEHGFCDNSQLGRFIIDLPEGKSLNETSFCRPPKFLQVASGITQTAILLLQRRTQNTLLLGDAKHLLETNSWTEDKATDRSTQALLVHWRMTSRFATMSGRLDTTASQLFLLQCCRTQNKFNGKLPAADYPKVNFYFVMF
ncbi:hypothetical protein A0H81_01184 [Grifola frondosa]|uniref:PTM1-like N-terminal domain-containing protein n=1 Tax=Grifola frondosa TaxID=5627 RepID=A0A1C7MQQ9_GRIFR|nr:hypothetical protein A0H81_01184 [Grifola frondosa]